MGMRETAAVVLLATSVMVGCSGGPSGPSDESEDDGVSDSASLASALRSAGAIVDPAGVVSQSFFVPQG